MTTQELQEILRKSAGYISGTERVPVAEADGRILAAKVTARQSHPPKPIRLEGREGRGKTLVRGALWKAGEVLIPAGRQIGISEIAVLSQNGNDTVLVARRIRVAILSMGSDAVAPGEDLPRGKIYDSSYQIMHAVLNRLGAEIIHLGLAGEDSTDAADRIYVGMEQADMVLAARRVRPDQEDPVEEVFRSLGIRQLADSFPINPYSVFRAGLFHKKPVLVLPGDSTGVFLALHLFVRVTMAAMTGIREMGLQRETRILQETCGAAAHIWTYIPGVCSGSDVRPAGYIRSAADAREGRHANCLIVVPDGNRSLKKGEPAEVLIL